ncbi:MAG: choline kinase, partial [Planctomycetota bacterium]
MKSELQNILLTATGAQRFVSTETLQELWSGYGSIERCVLAGGERGSVVVKHVRLPEDAGHPRGWDTDLSHERKVESYRVETAWYRDWAGRCTEACRVPACLALERLGDEVVMVLEDL